MADETPTLGEVIERAVWDYFQKHSGMPLAFVAAVDWIDGSDGASTLTVKTFDDQPTHRSMGLVRYLDKWFDDDAENEIMAATYAAASAPEDEDDE